MQENTKYDRNIAESTVRQLNVFEQDNEIKNIWYRKNVEFMFNLLNMKKNTTLEKD